MTHIRRPEDIQDVSWRSIVSSIYVLCPGACVCVCVCVFVCVLFFFEGGRGYIGLLNARVPPLSK